jgi:hypothetical protein
VSSFINPSSSRDASRQPGKAASVESLYEKNLAGPHESESEVCGSHSIGSSLCPAGTKETSSKDISLNAWQHVHLIGAFNFVQTESQIIDAPAAPYDDPDFWNRAVIEEPGDSLAQLLDKTFTVLERWAFLSELFRRK